MPGTNPGTTGLVSWWSLDEASGQRNDSHGANHLTDNNTVLSAAGVVGNAADFEADNVEFLSLADNADISVGDIDFTFVCAVNLESLPTGVGDSRRMAAHYDYGNNQRSWAIRYERDTNRLQFLVSPNGISAVILNADSLGIPVINTWYFVMVWHDAAADTINIQVNNGTIDSAAYSTGVHNSTAPFALGVLYDNGVAENQSRLTMDGLIDEASFWKRVFTADERTWLYNAGAGRAYSELAAGLAVPMMLASDQFAGGISL